MNKIVVATNENIFKIIISKNIVSGTNVFIDLDYDNIDSFIQELSYVDFFSEKKNYIINSISCFEKKSSKITKEQQQKLAKIILGSSDVFYFFSKKNIFKETELYTLLKDVFEVEIIEDEKNFIDSLITNHIKSKNIIVDSKTISLLKLNLNADVYSILNELDKLSLLNINNEVTITSVEQLGYKTIEEDVFKFVELVIKKDLKRAKLLYVDIIKGGTTPITLLEIFATQVRFYYQVKVLSENYGPIDISKLLNTHLFRVKKTLISLSSVSIFSISNIYLKTSKVEVSVKSGLIDPDLIFDLIIQ